MAKDSSSQKFIGKNNAPRVQIEYDVELYGSQKKWSCPLLRGSCPISLGIGKSLCCRSKSGNS